MALGFSMAALVYQSVLVWLCLLPVWAIDLHTDCCNVSGVWENSLGSVLRLSVESSYLSGTLQTSVESSAGAAGEGMLGVVSGVLGAGKQPTFTMSVSWDGGSASAWAGQCFWRSRGPILRTMWLMRTEVSTEKENWQATRIGEDTFHPKRSHKD